MFQINFLSADRRIAKEFTPTEKKPYPNIYYITSISYTISSIEDFYQHLVYHANRGDCLLKGEVQQPLVNESRAGSTLSDSDTWYSCIDLDRCPERFKDPESFIRECLPPDFHGIDYIWQWSNSAGISKLGLAGHLFFLHEQPINCKILKKIYTSLNFTNDDVEACIHLSHNGCSLTYGIDPTTAQNDKLIFIANPILIDIQDPYPTNRITLVKKEKRALTLDLERYNIVTIDSKIQTKINQLRTEAGLPRKKPKLKLDGTIEYLTNPERAIFRGPFITARGFVYGNLNNGDSYAYFHTEDNPRFLFNFKGEPTVLIKDIDPDYWRQLLQNKTPSTKPNHKYYAFRDQVQDRYYTIIYDAINDHYESFTVSNLEKAINFLKIHNQPIPDNLPIWNVVFEPEKDYVIDDVNMRLNIYQKTTYLKNASTSVIRPPLFDYITKWVVNNNPDTQEDLINWLAYIVQKKEKTQTAFILHGRTGTGKGILFKKILSPILGERHCKMVLMDAFDDGFNEWVYDGLLIVVDEAQVSDDIKKTKKRINKIKNIITESTTRVNIKNVTAFQHENKLNFIFTSNEHDSIVINEDDRRFKVAERQESPITITEKDLIKLERELQDITDYLMTYPVNEQQVRTIQQNDARNALITNSKSNIDEFIDILKAGNLDALLPFSGETATQKNIAYKDTFERAITEWSFRINIVTFIPTSLLRDIYMYLFNVEIGAIKFGKLIASKSLRNEVRKINKQCTRCIHVVWKSDLLPTNKEDIQQCGLTVN